MLIRDKLVKTQRRYLLLTFVGMVVWGALLLDAVVVTGGQAPPWLFAAAVPVFGVILLGVIGTNFLVRCPRCRGNLSRVGPLSARPWLGRRSVANCPFCGVSLDSSVAP
jgi:hypothetical protein